VTEATPRRVNWLNVIFLMGTLLGAVVSVPWFLITHGFGWPEWLTFFGLWLAVGISVTGGYHRLFAHRTYRAAWPVRLFYLIFGAAALENSAVNWTGDHRIHHSNVDHDRDPYNIQKGFWWAHMGWIFFDNEPVPPTVVRDLLEDPLVRWQAKWYGVIGLGVTILIPLLVGLATHRVLGCLLIGSLLRVVVSHHGTFFINSACHMVGRQPYSREHSARDSGVMAVLAFGEGYHNYHHSFPFDYRNGIKRWHFDPAKWAIYCLSKIGLARDLRRATDATVLKARIDVQFERAKEKLDKVVAEARDDSHQRLHEIYGRLQAALHEIVALQRNRRPTAPAPLPAAPAAETPESRIGALHRSVEQELREWKQALRQMRRLPTMSTASLVTFLLVPLALLALAAASSGGAAWAQGTRVGPAPTGPAPQGAMPSPTAQQLPDDVEDTAAALRDASLKGTKAYSIVQSLTTEVGPRPAGSEGLATAVTWGVRTLKDFGFSNVHTEKVMVPHWVRGQETGEIVAPYPQRVALAALGGSVGTTAAGIQAPVVMAASLDDLDKLPPAQVKGSIVFLNVTTDRTRDGSGYGKAVPARALGAVHAAKLGAVAVLVRSIGTDQNRLPHTGAMRYQDGVAKIPAAALSIPDADLLVAELASGKPVRFLLKLGAKTLPQVQAANVIGDIPGTDKANEIVLLGAHLDSWDLGTGAIDDGAGCAIVIEAARRIGELKTHPHRTIRVVLFANEEFGLSGAEAYAKDHAGELPQHVVALESDLGSGRVWRIESRVTLESMGWVHDMARLVFPIGAVSGTNEGDGGADLEPMQRSGVPILSLMQDATQYFDYHHTANDTLDKINPKDLDYNVAAWTAVAYASANMPGDYGRVVFPSPRS
jgi:carboxypeptidase Q